MIMPALSIDMQDEYMILICIALGLHHFRKCRGEAEWEKQGDKNKGTDNLRKRFLQIFATHFFLHM